MKVTVISPKELEGSLVTRWKQIRLGREDLVSPFFHPAFTQVVGHWRKDLRVAVIESAGKVTGFFPFHIGQHRIGQPAGEFLSDYHGVIGLIETADQILALLRGCGLICWDYGHLPVAQAAFSTFHWGLTSSPVIDVSRGYATFVREKRAAAKELIKARRLERDIGPLRFTYRDISSNTWEALEKWKGAQYLRTGKNNIFQIPWVNQSLREIAQMQSDDGFEGAVSTLHAGDQLLAVHFGMRDGMVWHYWFPAFDTAYSRYSAGFLLLLKMAEHAAATGTRWIDLGQGLMLYKERLANLEIPLAVGSVEGPYWYVRLRKARRTGRRIVANSLLGPSIRKIVHKVRKLRETGHRVVQI